MPQSDKCGHQQAEVSHDDIQRLHRYFKSKRRHSEPSVRMPSARTSSRFVAPHTSSNNEVTPETDVQNVDFDPVYATTSTTTATSTSKPRQLRSTSAQLHETNKSTRSGGWTTTRPVHKDFHDVLSRTGLTPKQRKPTSNGANMILPLLRTLVSDQRMQQASEALRKSQWQTAPVTANSELKWTEHVKDVRSARIKEVHRRFLRDTLDDGKKRLPEETLSAAVARSPVIRKFFKECRVSSFDGLSVEELTFAICLMGTIPPR